MPWNQSLFRLTASAAIAALLAPSAPPWLSLARPAAAQPAPPPLPLPGDAAVPAQDQPDPPERVGRVARIGGTASFRNQGDAQWSALSVNYPVSAGNAFWTQPGSTAALEVSDSRIALAGGTEVDLARLDATGLDAVAAHGEAYFALRNLAPGEAWTVQTPRGLVRLNGPGRYGVTVGTTRDPTLVTVLDGSASVEAPGLSLQVGPGQTASLTGTDSFQGSIGPALRDAFLASMAPAPQPVRIPAQVAATVTAMPGGADLSEVGAWADAPQYGQVWYPPVDPGWVPYRQGHWAFVAPWGWTWIDDAPWGFAPFHYGRWIEIGGRWAWTPGERHDERRGPAYAPALVTFLGIAGGVAIGAALASNPVAWVPLGPREPYRPWYRASDAYVRQVNVSHGGDRAEAAGGFVNRAAATAVPAATMAGSRPVAAAARPVTAQELAAARPVIGQQPLRPTTATAGVTPAVARQFGAAPAGTIPGGTGGFRPAPGPAVRAGAPGPAPSQPTRPGLAPPQGAVVAPTPQRFEPQAARPAPPPQRFEPQAARPAPPPQRFEPQAARPAPPPQRFEPQAARPAPAPQRVEPQAARPAPPPQRVEPQAARPAPAPQRFEPQPARPAPAPQRVEPPAAHVAPPQPQPHAEPARPAPAREEHHKRPGEP